MSNISFDWDKFQFVSTVQAILLHQEMRKLSDKEPSNSEDSETLVMAQILDKAFKIADKAVKEGERLAGNGVQECMALVAWTFVDYVANRKYLRINLETGTSYEIPQWLGSLINKPVH